MTSNRKIRYIDALLMMLLRGQTAEKLFSYARINLINIERREEYIEYPHLRHKLSQFTFLNMYNLTASRPMDPDAPFVSQTQRLDTVDTLNICAKSNLPYCLMLEDDAVPMINFIEHLEKVVIGPMRREELKPASVSLFSYESHPWAGTRRIDTHKYMKMHYSQEKSKMNFLKNFVAYIGRRFLNTLILIGVLLLLGFIIQLFN